MQVPKVVEEERSFFTTRRTKKLLGKFMKDT